MTVTLSTIKTNLRTKNGRGTSLDSYLANHVQQAIRHIERKKNWPFMYHLNTVTNDLEVTYPRTLRIPNRRVRAIDFMRITHEMASGETTATALASFRTLNKCINLKNWNPPESGYPTEYFLAQDNLIMFDNEPDKVFTFEVGWWEFTVIATDDTYEHWLFDNAQDLVEDLATYYAAKGQRDYQRAGAILQLCAPQLDELIAAAEDAELEDSELVMRQDFYSDLMG